jgi:hypothetical protein
VAGLKWGLISGIGIMTVGFGIGVVGIITEIAQHL